MPGEEVELCFGNVSAAGPSIAATKAAVYKAMKERNFELAALHRKYFFETPSAEEPGTSRRAKISC